MKKRKKKKATMPSSVVSSTYCMVIHQKLLSSLLPVASLMHVFPIAFPPLQTQMSYGESSMPCHLLKHKWATPNRSIDITVPKLLAGLSLLCFSNGLSCLHLSLLAVLKFFLDSVKKNLTGRKEKLLFLVRFLAKILTHNWPFTTVLVK